MKRVKDGEVWKKFVETRAEAEAVRNNLVKLCAESGCTNKSSSGVFVGEYCKPCHLFLKANTVQGRRKNLNSTAGRNFIRRKRKIFVEIASEQKEFGVWG